MAYDILHQSSQYADQYTPEQMAKFDQYLQMQSQTPDVSPADMRENLLKIYATPVENHYKAISEQI